MREPGLSEGLDQVSTGLECSGLVAGVSRYLVLCWLEGQCSSLELPLTPTPDSAKTERRFLRWHPIHS